MADQAAISFVIHSAAQAPRATALPGSYAGRGLLARCGAWLHRLSGDLALRGMEPRLARDIGAMPARDGRPEGFAADPRPLWGIGLTPQPMDTDPPWRRRG